MTQHFGQNEFIEKCETTAGPILNKLDNKQEQN